MTIGAFDPARAGSVHASGEPLLRLESVGKRYGAGLLALDGLDVDIGARECVGIVGLSGCGKSTALRLMAGLEEPTTGSITWSAGQAPPLGFVFQDPALMPWATAAENVYLPLRLQGMARRHAQARIDDALDSVGLRAFAQAYPRELSGGMRMRVSIARAFVTQPAVLLMDEPFAALDELTRGRLNDDLLTLAAARRLAIVFVTHSVYEAVYLCDRVLVMTRAPGRIAEAIDIDEPRPRGEAYRNSARYGESCARVSQALHRAVGDETPR